MNMKIYSFCQYEANIRKPNIFIRKYSNIRIYSNIRYSLIDIYPDDIIWKKCQKIPLMMEYI